MADDNALIEISVPDTQLMGLEIVHPEDSTLIEVLDLGSQFEVNIGEPPENMSLEFVIGGIKGDKGDPGGVTVTRIALNSLAGNRVVIQNSDDTVSYASSDNASHANRILGVTTHAATAAAEIAIQLSDIMTEVSWSWEPNAPVFLGSDGMLTQDINSTGLFFLQVGTALSATKLLIDKQIPVFK